MTMLPVDTVSASENTVTLEEMRARAEAMVNYEWIPSEEPPIPTSMERLNNKNIGLLQQYLNGWEVELG